MGPTPAPIENKKLWIIRVALVSAIRVCFFWLKVGTMRTSKVVLVLRKNLQGLAGDNSKMRTCKINNAEVAT